MNFLEILEEASTIQEARQAVKEIENYLNSLEIYPDNRKYIKYVQEAIIKFSDRYSRYALVFAAQMIRTRHKKNIGSVAHLTKDPISESATPKETMNHYIKYIFFRIREKIPNLKNTFAMAQVILKYIGKELHQFSPRQLEYFVKGVEKYITHYNKNYRGGILKYLNARQNLDDVYSNVQEPESARLRIEGANPYLTQAQKYDGARTETPHHQGLKRTTEMPHERKTLGMVGKVHMKKKNPYIADVANKAQTKSKILTPIEIQQISDGYNIDFDDRRVKTIKGKTNMILTPLKNGGWKLEHR